MEKSCTNYKHGDKSFASSPCAKCAYEGNRKYWEPECDDNPYWKRISCIADEQRTKGMSKYGVGLENNTANATERVRHIQEELIDALMYLTWLEEKLKEGEADDQ